MNKYFVYITTNPSKTVLYIGVTNDMERRLNEHFENRGQSKTFAGRYFCYNLIYFEEYNYISQAIEREKELKKWSRKKKNDLIKMTNPNFNTLNMSYWEY